MRSIVRILMILLLALLKPGTADAQSTPTPAERTGDYRAYFLQVVSTLPEGNLSELVKVLEMNEWKTQTITFSELKYLTRNLKPTTATSGEVVIIQGGSTPLTDIQLGIITDYLDNGGNLVLFAEPRAYANGKSLATTDKLNDYLWRHYGLRFRNDAVMDSLQRFRSPLLPVATDLNKASAITNDPAWDQHAVLLELPHSIDIAPQTPANVTVTALIRTHTTSYAKTDLRAVLRGQYDSTEQDIKGPFVVGVQVEDSNTGSRLVIFGSTSLADDQYILINGLENFRIAVKSLAWATRFDEFYAALHPSVTAPVAASPEPALTLSP